MAVWPEEEEEEGNRRRKAKRTTVYHWRCLLMSQKDTAVATIVKKPVIIQPTSCATKVPINNSVRKNNGVLS